MPKQVNQQAESIAAEITGAPINLGRGSKQAHRPSAQTDFGVYATDLRSILREFKSRLRGESPELLYELAIALLSRNNTECRQLAYELLAGDREAYLTLSVEQITRLGAGIDNWACVDSYCCTLVGTAWRRGQMSDADIMGWSCSDDLWWRRAAVVATVPLNLKSRGGFGDTRRTLMLCDALKTDREAMIQKAISWTLRELVRWDRSAVERFLADNEIDLSARVKREVTKKLITGKKN